MKTKAQKIKVVAEGVAELKKAETLVFADFSGVTVEEFKKLRRALREIGASFAVIKKRLLKIMLGQLGVELDLKQFDSQLGTAISPKDISLLAQAVYKFSKEATGATKKERFKILGGINLTEKRFIDAAEVKMIGQLPPREILLGQLMGAISGPMRAFLYILDQKAKQTTNNL